MTTTIKISALQASLTLACDIHTFCHLPVDQKEAVKIGFMHSLTQEADKNWHSRIRCDAPAMSNIETHISTSEIARHGYADQDARRQYEILLKAFERTYRTHLKPTQNEEYFGSNFSRLFVQSKHGKLYKQNEDIDFKVNSCDLSFAWKHLFGYSKQRGLLHDIFFEVRHKFLTEDTIEHAIANQELVEAELGKLSARTAPLLQAFWECSAVKSAPMAQQPVNEIVEKPVVQLKPVFQPNTH